MYLAANFNVWIFDSLSDGRVGMILRKAENASFRLCVRCRSRTLAKTRWDWTSWCWRWFNSSVGEALLPLPELDPWSMSLAADLCLWCSRLCLLHEAPPSRSWCWWWLLWWTLLSPLCSDPPESESNEFSDRRLRLFCWWWWYWLWWLFGGERLFSCCMWCMWLSSYSWWPVLNNSGSVDEIRKRPKIECLFVFENEFGGVKFEWMCGYRFIRQTNKRRMNQPKRGNMSECCCWWRRCSSLMNDDRVSMSLSYSHDFVWVLRGGDQEANEGVQSLIGNRSSIFSQLSKVGMRDHWDAIAATMMRRSTECRKQTVDTAAVQRK